ncbi:AbrB/MazE/SpoVT family DNA-binding domain-containing protein [Singulisphaera sp. PoT]|uniref:AbrB/MazE/SpoVT family DNA-binding domain-containing protein n=1 Tax=Singulisphaera sp. PoT TaxID=3411797 RepID=UPI003BF606B5
MENVIRGKVSGGGRVILPAGLRKELGIGDGSDVVFSRTDEGIHVTTLARAIRRAQAEVRRFVPEGTSLVRNLREERRQDAAAL